MSAPEQDAPWSPPATTTPTPAQEPAQPAGESQLTPSRDAKGKWLKGRSGNPGGAAKPSMTGSLSKALDGIVDRSILAKTLWNLAQGLDVHGRRYKRPNLSVQMAAVQYVYDRLEGKPLMQLRTEGDTLAGIIILHPGRTDPAELIEGESQEVTESEGADGHMDLDVKRAPHEE